MAKSQTQSLDLRPGKRFVEIRVFQPYERVVGRVSKSEREVWDGTGRKQGENRYRTECQK